MGDPDAAGGGSPGGSDPDSAGESDEAAGGPSPDPALRTTFWRLVVLYNLALLAAWLGVLLAVFEARYRDGAALVAVGAGTFLYATRIYRRETAAVDED